MYISIDPEVDEDKVKMGYIHKKNTCEYTQNNLKTRTLNLMKQSNDNLKLHKNIDVEETQRERETQI